MFNRFIKLLNMRSVSYFKTENFCKRIGSINVHSYLLDRTKDPDEILKNLKPEDSERLEFIKAEHLNLLDEGADVPNVLSSSHLLELLSCSSRTARRKTYQFLFVNQIKKQNRAAKKLNKVKIFSDQAPTGSDRILRVVDEKAVKSHYEHWAWSEIRCPDSSQQLVFDFTLDSEMRLKDQKNLALQMNYVLLQNRLMRPYPFHLVLCGLKPGTNQYSFMTKAFGINNENCLRSSLSDHPWSISPNPYFDNFPLDDKDRPVICLSPNASRAFEPGEWNHNAIYVIGAVVDKSTQRPITFARARHKGIPCVRLPLERYLKWRDGKSKTLTVNCIHAIMATAKKTNGDWEAALKENIPSRFFYSDSATSREFNTLFDKI